MSGNNLVWFVVFVINLFLKPTLHISAFTQKFGLGAKI